MVALTSTPGALRAVERVLENERFQPLIREQAPFGERAAVVRVHPEEYFDAIEGAAPKAGIVQLDAGGAGEDLQAQADDVLPRRHAADGPRQHVVEQERGDGELAWKLRALAPRVATAKQVLSLYFRQVGEPASVLFPRSVLRGEESATLGDG